MDRAPHRQSGRTRRRQDCLQSVTAPGQSGARPDALEPSRPADFACKSAVKHFQDWQSFRENETSALCRDVQSCSVGAGTAFAKRRGMLSFFMAGPDLVRWELKAVEREIGREHV